MGTRKMAALNIRIEPELVEAIDAWRRDRVIRGEDMIMISRAEAIRRLARERLEMMRFLDEAEKPNR